MDRLHIILLSILFLSATIGALECETGWVAFKDELCIKAFTNLLTFEETKELCSSQSNANAIATMVMVKEEDMQELLASYTQDVFNTVWLGGKYDEETGEYIWNDGEPVTYTNWQEGYPRNSTDTACLELRPINAKVENGTGGKWSDDAINEIIKLRKSVLPIGSIYIEYFGQPNPRELWPALTWEDISETYAGLFLRIYGGGSACWGETQLECSPRISQMSNIVRAASNGGRYPNPIDMPLNGWSEYGNAGEIYASVGSTQYYEGLRFNVENCEVRPKNQAIRIWKRIA